MPEHTDKPKTGHEKPDVKVHDLEPDKDAKGGGGKKPVSGGGAGGDSIPAPPNAGTN